MTFEESQRRLAMHASRDTWTPRPIYAREQSTLEAWRRERELNTAHARLTEYAKRGQIGPVDDDRPDPLGR